MSKFFAEFKKFIMRGNVIDLAVGIVIGAAFGRIVESLVADVFMPLIGLITGGFNVSEQKLILYKDAAIKWGNFLQMVINFVIIGFCLFLVVKGMNRLKELQVIGEAPPPEPTPSEKLLAEIRDLLKKQADDRAVDNKPL